MTACLLRDQCIGQSRSDDQRAKRIYYDSMYNVYMTSIIRIIRIIRLLSIVWCGLLYKCVLYGYLLIDIGQAQSGLCSDCLYIHIVVY